jgi:hypothetical protein
MPKSLTAGSEVYVSLSNTCAYFMSVSHTFHVLLISAVSLSPLSQRALHTPFKYQQKLANCLAPDFKEGGEVGSRLRIVNSKVHLAANSSKQSLRLYGRMTSVYRVTNQTHPRGDKGAIFMLFVGRALVRISALGKISRIRVTKSHVYFNLTYPVSPRVN